MTAFLLLILVTPIERTIVTTAARPSGIAATASETATIKVSRTVLKLTASPTINERTISNAKINTQIPRTNMDKIRDN